MPETSPLKTELPAPFLFSQSSLQDYDECARRFQLRYIEQLRWPAIETAPVLENERRQVEGQQFHRMLQQYLLSLPADTLTRMANTENLGRWWENFIKSDLANLGKQQDANLYPELTLSAPIGRHRIMAKYDLIALKPGAATIFDWKTYHKRPQDAWMSARLQTKVYRALLIVAGSHLNARQPFAPQQVEMVYWYADFPGEPAKFPYTEAQHQRDWNSLNILVNEISAKQSFPMTSDEKKCAFCPYRSYCERGIQAGEGDELEAEISVMDVTLEQIQEIEF